MNTESNLFFGASLYINARGEALNSHITYLHYYFRSSIRRSLQKLRKKREKRQGKDEKDPVVGEKEKQGKRGKYEINIREGIENTFCNS